MNKKSLEELLEEISVHSPGAWYNAQGPQDWYAVSSDEAGGIFAYFQYENDAFLFRLDLINNIMNPLKK